MSRQRAHAILATILLILQPACSVQRIGDDTIADLGRDAGTIYYADKSTGKLLIIEGQQTSASFKSTTRLLAFIKAMGTIERVVPPIVSETQATERARDASAAAAARETARLQADLEKAQIQP